MLVACEKLFKLFKDYDYDSGSKRIKKIGNHSIEFVKLNDDYTVARFKYFGHTILSIALLDHHLIVGDEDYTYISDCGWNTISTKRALRSYIELISSMYGKSTFNLFSIDSSYAKRVISQLLD